jgi:hypothetical protein
VRVAVDTPDAITASAINARDEIGRAVAAQIRELRDADDLKRVAEDVLPQIEKFLESPAERRLRRIRLGTILSSVGIGVAIAFLIVAVASSKVEFLPFAGLGFITFCVGLGFTINGFFLSAPKASLSERSSSGDQGQSRIDGLRQTGDLRLGDPPTQFSSVTENTTRHLEEKSSQ